MVSVFVSRSSGPGSSPVRGHCVLFWDKTSASLHPDEQMGNGEFKTKSDRKSSNFRSWWTKICTRVILISKFSAPTIAFLAFDWLKNSDYEPIVGVLRHIENSAPSFLFPDAL